MNRLDRWLDRAALAVAPGPGDRRPASPPRSETPTDMSRASALRVIGGGVAMLAAGPLLAAGPAAAEDTDDCKADCQDAFRHAQAKRLNKCTEWFNHYDPSRSVDLLLSNPWAATGLSTLCYGVATQATRRELLDCKASCDKNGKPTQPTPTCGASTRAGANAAANQGCYAPPQPPRLSQPAEPPPPPADTSSQCEACKNVGGYCLTCSDGTFNCGTPGVAPSRYCPGG